MSERKIERAYAGARFSRGHLDADSRMDLPSRPQVRIRSVRLVSFTQRAVVAISYRVEPMDGPIDALIQSELVVTNKCRCGGPTPEPHGFSRIPSIANTFIARTRRPCLCIGRGGAVACIASAMSYSRGSRQRSRRSSRSGTWPE